jgi:Epoxide hydrolase N terminus
MAYVSPYIISVPDSQIEDLKQRLALAKFPDELEAAEWELGAPLADIKRLTTYWKDHFDWRKTEQNLNRFPQYVTDIQCDGFEGLKIHFLHKKSKVDGAIPLLFVHGWPGSFIEATKIINILSQGGDGQPAFDVVAPSLPNYGFSEGSKKRGFALEQYAETFNKLMLRLGYQEYVTQGG